MKDIQTVTGALDPSLLGFTLMHEHLLISSWNNRITDPEWLPYEKALDFIAPVIADAKAAGVDSIVDCSPFNLGRDVLLLRDVSERTGINIIATTGVYMDESGWLNLISEENLLKYILREIQDGTQGTQIRCGAIKCATDRFGFTPINRKTLRACARAAIETDLPIITHCRPENTRQGLFQQDIFEELGVDLNHVLIGHFREGDPLDYAENVMRRGSYIGIDQMNFNAHHLAFNLDTIVELIRRGWTERLMLSHDAVIGYKECLGCLAGECTQDEAVAEIKLRSRQYAKRQLTWLRRNRDIHWFYRKNSRDLPAALQFSTEILTNLGVS